MYGTDAVIILVCDRLMNQSLMKPFVIVFYLHLLLFSSQYSTDDQENPFESLKSCSALLWLHKSVGCSGHSILNINQAV